MQGLALEQAQERVRVVGRDLEQALGLVQALVREQESGLAQVRVQAQALVRVLERAEEQGLAQAEEQVEVWESGQLQSQSWYQPSLFESQE